MTDNKCGSISDLISGDDNSNNLLDAGETWVYSCAMNLTKTTTNTATAVGTANAMTASDSSIAMVVVIPTVVNHTRTATTTTPSVAAPASQLPVTGADLENNGILWDLAVSYVLNLYKVL